MSSEVSALPRAVMLALDRPLIWVEVRVAKSAVRPATCAEVRPLSWLGASAATCAVVSASRSAALRPSI